MQFHQCPFTDNQQYNTVSPRDLVTTTDMSSHQLCTHATSSAHTSRPFHTAGLVSRHQQPHAHPHQRARHGCGQVQSFGPPPSNGLLRAVLQVVYVCTGAGAGRALAPLRSQPGAADAAGGHSARSALGLSHPVTQCCQEHSQASASAPTPHGGGQPLPRLCCSPRLPLPKLSHCATPQAGSPG